MINKLLSILFVAAFLFCSPAQAGTGGAAQSNLSTLMGVDLSSLESGYNCTGTACSYTPPCPATTGIDPECQHYRNLNLMTWRVATTWSGWQPTLGGSLNSTYIGYVDNIRRQAALLGACVIIDMHNFGGYPGMATIGASGGPTVAQFVGVWELIAAQFVGKAGMCGYEPQNEPANMSSGSAWPTAAQAVITGIRTIDTANTIYIDGDSYATAANWLNTLSSPVACGYSTNSPLSDGNNGLKNLVDPNDNLVFAAHGYPDYNSSGSFPVYGSTVNTNCTTTVANTQCTVGQDSFQCAQAMGNQLLGTSLTTNVLVDDWTGWVNWCNTSLNPRGEHIKCWMGESAAPRDNSNWNTVLDNGINFLQQNGILFTYWSGGPYASSTYGIYPSGLGTSNVTDTAEVAVLTKYSNSYQPKTYGLVGPARGTASVASTSFTTPYYGLVKKAVTITPSDNGGSGTFTPSTVTCSPNFNCFGSFTYTAPASSVYKISTTNSYGFTDPAAIGYATASDQFLTTSASAVNACSFRKIYAPYIGPLVNLRRASDNATMDFYPTSLAVNSPLNVSAITTWANGSNLYLTTCYDQEPAANNFYPVYVSAGNPLNNIDPDAASHSPTPSTADQAQFFTSCPTGNSLPCAGATAFRMASNSPLNNASQQTVLSVFAPTLHWGGEFLGWDWSGTVNFDFWTDDQASYTNTGNIRLYSQDATMGAIGISYTQNGTTGMRGFLNGSVINQGAAGSTALSLPNGRTNLNMGYQRFGANTFSGYFSEIVILNNTISDSYIQAWQANQDSYWGISAYPSYSKYSPTLNQNPSAANTLPLAGVNSSGLDFGYPFYPNANAASYWAGQGANVTRIPVKWEYIQPTLGGALSSTVMGGICTKIAADNALGVDDIIDIHNSGQYNGYNINGTSGPTYAQFAALWSAIASYSCIINNPKVQFDLDNEPGNLTGAVNLAASQAAITAIRAAESVTHTIHYEDPAYQCYNVASIAGANFLTLTGGAGALWLQCHSYNDSNNSGTSDYGASGVGVGRISGATTWATTNSVKLFLGETGIGFTPSMYAEDKAMFDYIAAHQSAWAGFTVWGAGPAWSENYIYKMEPNVLTGTIIDRPMARMFNTYATGHTWPATQTFPNCYGTSSPCTVQFP